MTSPASVKVARLLYLLVCEAAGVAISLSTRGSTLLEIPISAGIIGGLVVALFFIWVESLMRGFTLRGFSTAAFGLAVGLFCAWLLTRVGISDLIAFAYQDRVDSTGLVDALQLALNITLYASLGFIGTVLALRGSRDDFAFIIPYVRFRQDASSGQPIVLDADALIDGRFLAISRSGFLNGRLIIPRFVLDALHQMSGSSSATTRQRGTTGLQNLEKLKADKEIQLTISEVNTSHTGDNTDARLIDTAQVSGARILTLNDNLTKVAKLQNVDTLNLNDLDAALRPEIAIGQRMRIALVRTGKEDHQAVGYLPDGTMIVVNQGVPHIGSTIDVVVTSTLQTSTGTMVFAEKHA